MSLCCCSVFSLAFATIGLGETQVNLFSILILTLGTDKLPLLHDQHQAVAQYYDIPVITTRNLLLPGIFKNASTAEDWFANPIVDGLHILDTRHVS